VENLCGIEVVFRTEAVARRAGTVRRIETEGPWFENRHADSAIGAGEFFGKDVLLAADDGDGDEAAGEF